MFNEKFDIVQQIASQELTTEPQVYRWICLDQTLQEKTFALTSFKELNALNSSFHKIRWIQNRIESSTFNFVRFEHCLFEGVHFENTVFRHVKFVQCSFIQCGFSLKDESLQASVEDLSFDQCYFKQCELQDLLGLFEKSRKEQILNGCLLSNTPVSNFHMQTSTLLEAKPQKELDPALPVSDPIASAPSPAPISSEPSPAKFGQGRFEGLELG